MEASRAFNSIAANRKHTFSIMHINVSRAPFHARAQRLVLVRLPVEDRIGANADNWSVEEGYVRHTGRSKQLGGVLASKAGDISWDSARRTFFVMRHRVSGMRHGDDFVLTGSTDWLTEFTKKSSVSNQEKIHQLRVNGEHQSIEQKCALEKARNCVSARSQACRRARERPRARARERRANTSSALT